MKQTRSQSEFSCLSEYTPLYSNIFIISVQNIIARTIWVTKGMERGDVKTTNKTWVVHMIARLKKCLSTATACTHMC